eukprot:TRINITY_DN17137_c0_g1_i3.p1 TRINITY_DN17137_c0_g1~~TRINITY_DN17137_c0_g1_i3.p1  ORF type:complete len:317 (+),score=65.65 TRINITY_DN17137_c0_g1_i3:49-999(+)
MAASMAAPMRGNPLHQSAPNPRAHPLLGSSVAGPESAPARLSSPPARADTITSAMYSSTRLGLLGSTDDTGEQGLSGAHVSVNILKCAIGAGSFSLPHAFKAAGLWAGVTITLLLGLASFYTVNLLVDAEKIYSRIQCPPGTQLSYPELCRKVFAPKGAGRTAEAVVNLAICCIALGACAAYLDFICETLTELHTDLSRAEATFLVVPVVLGLVLLRSFAWLSYTSLLGDIAVMAGLCTTIVYGATHTNTSESISDLPAVRLGGIGGFIGPTAFLFAIHFLMLPFAHSLKPSTSFRRVTAVTYTCLLYTSPSPRDS